LEPLATINFGEVNASIAFLSSMAIILGAIFVVLEIKDNKKMIEAATEQAKAAAIQADASAKQIQQNIEIADMDIIMRLYEFANSRESQSSYLTVVNSDLKSYDDFLKLPREDQISFLQISSLFESLGVLLDRGIITLKTVDDMFVPQIAWKKLKPFMDGVSANVIGAENFPYFAKLVRAMEAKNAEAAAKKSN
jgi:hypothetical protein